MSTLLEMAEAMRKNSAISLQECVIDDPCVVRRAAIERVPRKSLWQVLTDKIHAASESIYRSTELLAASRLQPARIKTRDDPYRSDVPRRPQGSR